MSTSREPLLFADLLRRYRLAAGLTQSELADAAGLAARGVSDLERGKRSTPRTETVRRLADALGLSEHERAALLAAARRPRHPTSSSPTRTVHLTHGPASPPLVGRVRELEQIERLLSGAGAPILLLAGEPGIGKSRLLHEAERLASERGWRVLRGECTRRSGQEPYAPLVGALERSLAGRSLAQQRRDLQGCAWLVRLLPALAETRVVPAPTWTLPPEQERRLMFAACGRFLSNVAGPLGTVLLLDDVQWAGADALELLLSLVPMAGHHDGERPLRVICAYRQSEVGATHPLAALLMSLAGDGRAEVMPVQPLAPEEAARLFLSVLQREGEAGKPEPLDELQALDEQALSLQRRAGGVPFFLVSCAQSLRAGAWDGRSTAGFPWTVKASVDLRMALLSTQAQEALRMGAVMGRILPTALLVAVAARSGRDEETVVAALEEACQAQLVCEAGDEAYAFTHDLIWEAIETDLRSARRRLLHRRIADALEYLAPSAHEPRAAELVWHFLQAGERARALPYALRAGDEAEAVFAHADAEHHYRSALELAGELGDRPSEAAASEKLATVLGLMTRYEEAIALCERTMALYRALGDVEGEGRAVWLIGYNLVEVSQPGQALVYVDEPVVGDLAARGLSVASQARLYAGVAHLLALRSMTVGEGETALADLHRAVALTDQAIELARAAKDDAPLALALFTRGLALELGERVDEALRDYEAAVPLVDEAGGELWIASNALAYTQYLYLRRGEFGTSQMYSERAIALADRIADPFALAISRVNHGRTAYYLGDWAQARADFEQAVTLTRTVGAPLMNVAPPLHLGLLCLVEGDFEAAASQLREALAVAERQHLLQYLRIAHGILAERDLVDGHPEAARDRLEPLLDRAGMQESQAGYVLPQLAWAYLELGDEERAEALGAESRTRAVAHRHRLFLVDVLRMQALIATRQSRWQEARDALEESLALCRAMPYPYAEAKALYVYGQLHSTQGEPERAREQYQTAIEICARLGEGLYRPHIERALADLDQR